MAKDLALNPPPPPHKKRTEDNRREQKTNEDCDPPDLLQESFGPFAVSGSVLGVSLGPFGPRAPECPKSVPRVSPECQEGVPDTPGTLSGHFLDTPAPRARRNPETLRETLLGHFGPEGPERLLWQAGGGGGRKMRTHSTPRQGTERQLHWKL